MDVFSFRMSLAHYYMGHVLRERLEPSLQMRKKYWGVFESHTAHGANLTPYDAELNNRLVLEGRMAEDIALKDDYDLQLRTATRHSKAAVGTTTRWPPSGKASSTCAMPN